VAFDPEMPADRPGQCGDDDEIAFYCGAEQSIGDKPLDLLGRERRWSCRYRGLPGGGQILQM
jgi:hypothetical protein